MKVPNINLFDRGTLGRETPNRYWTWDNNTESFDVSEQNFYERKFSETLAYQNQKYVATGHWEKEKTMDEYRHEKRYCPDTIVWPRIFKVTMDNVNTVWDIVQEMIDWQREQFPQCHLLNVALHMDEDSQPHIHSRQIWIQNDKETGLPMVWNTWNRSEFINLFMAKFREIAQSHGLSDERRQRLHDLLEKQKHSEPIQIESNASKSVEGNEPHKQQLQQFLDRIHNIDNTISQTPYEAFRSRIADILQQEQAGNGIIKDNMPNIIDIPKNIQDFPI